MNTPAGTGIRLAEDLDVLSREEIERLRQHNFARMLDAARRTPAVLRRWPRLTSLQDLDRLPELPPLTSAELAEGRPPHSLEFLLGGDGPGMVIRSSGTSRTPKVLYHSWEFNEQVSALGARGVRAGSRTPMRRVANCLLAAELNGAFLFAQEVIRLSSARAFPIGSTMGTENTAQVLAEHEVDTLIASPGFGVDVLTGVPAPQLAALRTFRYIGEGLGTEREKAVATALPDLDVRSLAYSTTETGCIGYQCAHQHGTAHHVHEDAVVVEVVDEETGAPLPEGEAGEVLVTPLSDTGMALFRYRIGDRGRLTSQPCACGSQARVLTLLGRAAQSLTVDSETFSTDHMMARLAELGITDPADCQLQVLWEGNRYHVRLLLAPHTPPGLTTSTVAAAFAGGLEIHQVVTGPRCAGFTVERTDLSRFARTDRGKVPTLYERFART
ncbi:phenylacetate--CoA ligase family protein [Streptomyces sp. NPDC090442]|uniref:phenylacetate--CoA ligase family protein n=1 Tax=Streptomyces sp. NPDC090442 TaxID=3365962 RepID=UPI0037FE11AD